MSTQVTCREYAVPYFRKEPLARDRLYQRVMHAIGDYETHQRLGYPMTTYKVTEYFQSRPEAWVSISGTSAVHSAMLAQFPWIPSANSERSRP